MDQTPAKTLDITTLAPKFNRLENSDLLYVISLKTTQFVNWWKEWPLSWS
jgi:hypothetical protein